MNVLFLLAVIIGGRDVFCYILKTGFFAYLHKTGEVYCMGPEEMDSFFAGPGKDTDKEAVLVAELLREFPTLSKKPSLVLYDPGQTQGNARVEPIGGGTWRSQMVIANSPRALNETWKKLALEKLRFRKAIVFDPSWMEFMESALVLGLAEAEARAVFLVLGPVLRNVGRFRMESPQGKDLSVAPPLPWPTTRGEFLDLARRLPPEAEELLVDMLELRGYINRVTIDPSVSAKVFGLAPLSSVGKVLPLQRHLESFLTGVAPAVPLSIREHRSRKRGSVVYVRSAALLLADHLHKHDSSTVSHLVYDLVMDLRLNAGGHPDQAIVLDPPPAKKDESLPKALEFASQQRPRSRFAPERESAHLELLRGLVAATLFCKTPDPPKAHSTHPMFPTPSGWERKW